MGFRCGAVDAQIVRALPPSWSRESRKDGSPRSWLIRWQVVPVANQGTRDLRRAWLMKAGLKADVRSVARLRFLP